MSNSIYSRITVAACVAIMVLSACKSSKPVTSQPAPKPPVSTTPAKPKEQQATEVTPPKKTEVVKRHFILVMPFELEQNFKEASVETTEPLVSPSSLPALNFYEGAMMAVDSLKKAQIDVKLSAFDTPGDSASVVRMMTNGIFKDAEIIFGTFPSNLAAVAANVAKTNKLNLVLTQGPSPDLLKENPGVALALASTITQCREMVNFIMNQYFDANIILVYRNLKREDELASVFREEIVRRSSPADFHEFNATNKEILELLPAISTTKRNLVFITSSDEAFVSPFLSLLEEQQIFGIKVCGLPTWDKFESIDFMSFNNIQTHLFDNNFIEETNPGASLFRKQFLQRYQAYPMPSAYNGFDLVYNLSKSMVDPRPELSKLISDAFTGRGNGYEFVSTNGGGYENKHISVLRIADYRLEQINK